MMGNFSEQGSLLNPERYPPTETNRVVIEASESVMFTETPNLLE